MNRCRKLPHSFHRNSTLWLPKRDLHRQMVRYTVFWPHPSRLWRATAILFIRGPSMTMENILFILATSSFRICLTLWPVTTPMPCAGAQTVFQSIGVTTACPGPVYINCASVFILVDMANVSFPSFIVVYSGGAVLQKLWHVRCTDALDGSAGCNINVKLRSYRKNPKATVNLSIAMSNHVDYIKSQHCFVECQSTQRNP